MVSLIDKEGPWVGLNVDVKGEIYEGACWKRMPQRYDQAPASTSPRAPVIEAMVKCLNPKIGETVVDPGPPPAAPADFCSLPTTI